MRRTALALVTVSILSMAACGDDSSSTAGGSGAGATGASGGTGGSTGTGGTGGTGGSSGGGQAGTMPGDASNPIDVRGDTPAGTTDALPDRPPTMDAPAVDTGSASDALRDTTSTPDGAPPDTSSPPEGGLTDAAPPTDAPGGGSDAVNDASNFVLTSTAFTEGSTIPAAHTCAGMNVSPPLSWTAGPAGTLSYAVVFTDKNNMLVHSGIYDIPANVTSLPMNIEKVAMPTTPAGSKQVQDYNGKAGYAGPCPGPTAHTYEFMLYAVKVATLPGVTTSQKGAALVTALKTNNLATTTLTGKAATMIR